jgi:hypothetical protein
MKLLTLTALYKFADFEQRRCFGYSFRPGEMVNADFSKAWVTWRALFEDMLPYHPRSDKLVKLTPTLTSRLGDQYVGEMDYSSNGE